jgi:hypothetical protein
LFNWVPGAIASGFFKGKNECQGGKASNPRGKKERKEKRKEKVIRSD